MNNNQVTMVRVYLTEGEAQLKGLAQTTPQLGETAWRDGVSRHLRFW